MKLTCKCGASIEVRDSIAGGVDANRWHELHVQHCCARTVTVPPLPDRDYSSTATLAYTSDQMRERDEYWIDALRAAGIEVTP